MNILPANPQANYQVRSKAIQQAVMNVLDAGHYILGPEVNAFETAFAKFLGVEHAVGVGSGTDALQLALRACGIGDGDAVFTVSNVLMSFTNEFLGSYSYY